MHYIKGRRPKPNGKQNTTHYYSLQLLSLKTIMETSKTPVAIPSQNLASAYAVPQNLATPTPTPYEQTTPAVAPHSLTSAVGPQSLTTTAGIATAPQKVGTPTSSIVPRSDQSLAARFLGSDNRSASRALGLDGRSTRSSLGVDHRRSRGGASDESELSKRILEIHESDERGLPVKPILHIIDVIFYRATADLPGFGIQV